MNKEENIDELMKRTSFNKCLPSFDIVEGNLLGWRYNEIKEKIDHFEVKDSDIWVCSYPKAGSTWTQEMIWLLVNNLDYKGAKLTIHFRFPLLELDSIFSFKKLTTFLGGKLSKESASSIEFINSLKTNPRCIKSHLPFNLLPKSIKNKEKQPKIVYIVRNPKDTCVSAYYHNKLWLSYTGTFEEFARLFLNDKVINSPYWGNLESYWEQRNEPNILIIKYEDMKRDLKSVVLKVAAFLDKKINDNEMDKLLNHLSFDSMKNNESTNYTEIRNNKRNEFIRKGIVGDYKNHMSEKLIKEFDDWIEKNNKIGITF